MAVDVDRVLTETTFRSILAAITGVAAIAVDVNRVATEATGQAILAALKAGDFLKAANNLSDVANETTSRGNLGAEPAATLNAINTQTASYTLVIADAGKLVEMNVAGANNLTIPPNSSVAFALNTRIDIVQDGAGQTTIVAGAGVTIRSVSGHLKLSNQYSGALLYKRGTDEWVLVGDLSA